MGTRKTIDLESDSLKRLCALPDDGTPLVMINLLRFRDQALYPAGFAAAPCTGREAYERYARAVEPLLTHIGARVHWAGTVCLTVISPDSERWHDASLVEYPARRKFIELILSSEYLAIAPHRMAALDDSRLIASRTRAPAFD